MKAQKRVWACISIVCIANIILGHKPGEIVNLKVPHIVVVQPAHDPARRDSVAHHRKYPTTIPSGDVRNYVNDLYDCAGDSSPELSKTLASGPEVPTEVPVDVGVGIRYRIPTPEKQGKWSQFWSSVVHYLSCSAQ